MDRINLAPGRVLDKEGLGGARQACLRQGLCLQPPRKLCKRKIYQCSITLRPK